LAIGDKGLQRSRIERLGNDGESARVGHSSV
jgi:hypothetical protein